MAGGGLVQPRRQSAAAGRPAGRTALRRPVVAGPQPRATTDHGLPGGAVNDEADQVRLGWQFAPALADPGPPPPRPVPGPADRLDPGWLAAQARICRVVSRPAR